MCLTRSCKGTPAPHDCALELAVNPLSYVVGADVSVMGIGETGWTSELALASSKDPLPLGRSAVSSDMLDGAVRVQGPDYARRKRHAGL